MSHAPPTRLPLDDAPSPSRGWWRGRVRLSAFERVQLLLVLWVAVSEVLRGGFGLTMLPQRGDPGPAVRLPTWGVVPHLAGAATYPLAAFFTSRRFPLWHRPGRYAVFYVAVLAGLHALAWLAGLPRPWAAGGWMFYVHRTFEFGVYTVFAHGMLYGERHHAQEREELRLRGEMAESTADRMRAQVRALRMEWSPRFLTGTLESIGDLLSRDVAAAKRLLLGLSSVLRRTLAHARMETVRLEQEVEFVREVLRVEALRRPGLQVEWEIGDEALEMPVPHLSLVTMVYQAVQDDVAGPARIRISAAADGADVLLRVDAPGVPFGEGMDAAAAAGVHGGYAFRRAPLDDGGVRVELRCASEPPPPEPRPAPDFRATDATGPRSGSPAAEAREPAVGRGLEMGTYGAFLLFYTLLTVYTEYVDVGDGSVVLTAPAWVYVAGMGAYATLWWASMALAARALSTRFPFRRGEWRGRLAVHLLGALAVALLNAVVYFPFQRLVLEGGSVQIGFSAYWEWGDLAMYPPLAGIAHGFIYAREYHARRISELRLRSLLWESELSRTGAELQALKAELNPHFLFNALNTVSSLMHVRVDEARRVVAHLSALLRRVLQSASLQEVTVAEEVEFIRLYMEIEQARFGDALRIDYDVEPATLHARVPHLLVQPLVENAVKHGLRPREGTGRVVLSARRAGHWLELVVADDGVGPAHAPAADGTGTGLANVRQRLRQLYGADHAFQLAAAPGGGARASVRIPFSEHPVASAEPVRTAGTGAGLPVALAERG
ncbi:MAG TPA: histidine kinase [Longimicrobium sp.]|uniref:histidine kinase n=1 Tax=Longimicrobium sp. TaxID=2029185 RepID=UPI002EDB12C8